MAEGHSYSPEENREAQDDFRKRAKQADMSHFSLGYVPNALIDRYNKLRGKEQKTHIDMLKALLDKYE